MEGRELHNNGLSEDTSSVLRDGGNDDNEIGKNTELFIPTLHFFRDNCEERFTGSTKG